MTGAKEPALALERPLDPQARKQTLRLLSNGLYIMTARDGDRCGAATITWLSQASFKPPLLMAAVRPESNVFRCLVRSGAVAVHVIGIGQQDVARRFFAPTRAADGQINGEPFTLGVTGAPILPRLHAWVECRVVRIIETGGDHAVVVMEVVEAQCLRPVEPLTIAASPWEYGG
jgi:flavin reductase (DIM6/NTAB) family NADH-FMN oxidoreductase RutF